MLKILIVKYPYGFWCNGYQYFKFGKIFIGIREGKLRRMLTRIRNKVKGII